MYLYSTDNMSLIVWLGGMDRMLFFSEQVSGIASDPENWISTEVGVVLGMGVSRWAAQASAHPQICRCHVHGVILKTAVALTKYAFSTPLHTNIQ